MNCAGKERSNLSSLRSGAPCRANGIDPESYQASMTSGTRRACPPHSRQVISTSSTYGRCGSSSVRSRPASSDSSASDPTQVTCCCAPPHSGSGVPQYLVRDRPQSTLLRSHSPYRPCLIVGGCQLVFSFSASSSSLIAVVRIYQEGSAEYIRGVW